MIPQDTLNIIEQEALRKYPVPNAYSFNLGHAALRRVWADGAKRGYELAMEDDKNKFFCEYLFTKEYLDKITTKHLNEKYQLQQEIEMYKRGFLNEESIVKDQGVRIEELNDENDRLKKENEELRNLVSYYKPTTPKTNQ